MVQLDPTSDGERSLPELRSLPDGARAVPFGRVRRVIEQDHGARVRERFSDELDYEVEPNTSAGSSGGSVATPRHRAAAAARFGHGRPPIPRTRQPSSAWPRPAWATRGALSAFEHARHNGGHALTGDGSSGSSLGSSAALAERPGRFRIHSSRAVTVGDSDSPRR